MKKFLGILLLIAGLCLGAFAMNMKTTVATESISVGGSYIPSREVHNVGLLDSRRNYLFVAGLFVLVGVILLCTGNTSTLANPRTASSQDPTDEPATRVCPSCAERVKLEAKVCRFCSTTLPVIDIATLQQQHEARAVLAQYNQIERSELDTQASLSETERRKSCIACSGHNLACGFCKFREKKLTAYLAALANGSVDT